MVTQRSLATAEGYAAQPGEQASSPATRSAMVIFATSSAIKNTTSCTTDAGETPAFQANAVFTLPLVRRRLACDLCFAERLTATSMLAPWGGGLGFWGRFRLRGVFYDFLSGGLLAEKVIFVNFAVLWNNI